MFRSKSFRGRNRNESPAKQAEGSEMTPAPIQNAVSPPAAAGFQDLPLPPSLGSLTGSGASTPTTKAQHRQHLALLPRSPNLASPHAKSDQTSGLRAPDTRTVRMQSPQRPQEAGPNGHWSPAYTPRIDSLPAPPEAQTGQSGSHAPETAAKQQKSKWKGLGIFGRKPSHTASPQVNSNLVQQAAGRHGVPHTADLGRAVGEPSRPRNKHRRASSKSLDPAQQESQRNLEEHSGRKLTRPPKAPRSKTVPVLHEPGRNPTPPPKDPGYESKHLKRLELNLPDLTMERYSVMFGEVLQPRQSSLMARRQVNLDKIKLINDQFRKEKIQEQDEKEDVLPPLQPPPRRTTLPLPSPKHSPSYNLFPPASPYDKHFNAKSARNPSPLRRAASSPVARSPTRGFFDHAVPQKDKREQSGSESGAIFELDTSPPSPKAQSVESFEISDEPDRIDIRPRRESLPQHRQIMVQARPPSPESNDADVPSTDSHRSSKDHFNQKVPTVTIQPSLPTPESTPPRELSPPPNAGFGDQSNAPNEAERPLKAKHSQEYFQKAVHINPLQSSPPSTTEVQIARQISISRRQRILVPINPRTVRQPMQPKVVDVQGNHISENGDDPQKGHVGRQKSQHAILDFA